MAENILSEIRQLLQDVIAPDLKALAVRVEGNQRHTELALKAMEAQLEAFRVELSAFRIEQQAFRAEMRAEFQAQRNLLQSEVLRETAPIRERLATLEAREARS
ncbi:MAG TPA: hypothetical protein VH250_07870 [Granulicella sp.]|jgi:uncharacterized protein with von Willebrand factor type A (vWA) domain|nr:hypothetical protein [Granulicella sp.]